MTAQFTDKQCDVFEQLLLHKTTKEIARELRIAPKTVEQRILAARKALGDLSRTEAIRRYAETIAEDGAPSLVVRTIAHRLRAAAPVRRPLEPARASMQRAILGSILATGVLIVGLLIYLINDHSDAASCAASALALGSPSNYRRSSPSLQPSSGPAVAGSRVRRR